MSSVTVIIPYKNNSKFLFLALKSVFNQTFKKFKIIIIYDDVNKSDLNSIKKFILEKKLKKKLSKLPRNSAKNRIRNRCQITGRPHGVYRKLKISRIALRQLGLQGKIPGMVKSSW